MQFSCAYCRTDPGPGKIGPIEPDFGPQDDLG